MTTPLLNPDFWPTATPEDVRAAVREGAKVNAKHRFLRANPLHLAAEFSADPQVIRTLVELGAEVNARAEFGVTPLHFAASRNVEPEVVRVLVKFGAEIDAPDRRSWTPLHHAVAFNPTYEVVLALLELGADHRARTYSGVSAWDVLQFNQALKDTPAYERLCQLGH